MSVLPPELEREIFELTLRSDLKNAALKLNLSLVARRVQFWIEPIFYEVVTISGVESASAFLSLIARKPPGFLHTAVKALCLVFGVNPDLVYSIVAACTGVEVLAFWVNSQAREDIPFLLSRLPLRHLSVESGHFLNIPTAPTWRSSLTHLELVFWVGEPSESNLSGLSQRLIVLPRLSHISSASPAPETSNLMLYAQAACSKCPDLEVLAISRSDSEPDFEATRVETNFFDPRVVLIDEVGDDTTNEWEAGYFGGADMWSRAEDAVRQQMNYKAD